jgi:hypothetical protein
VSIKKTSQSLGWTGMISHAAALSEVRVERLQHWVDEILEEIMKQLVKIQITPAYLRTPQRLIRSSRSDYRCYTERFASMYLLLPQAQSRRSD